MRGPHDPTEHADPLVRHARKLRVDRRSVKLPTCAAVELAIESPLIISLRQNVILPQNHDNQRESNNWLLKHLSQNVYQRRARHTSRHLNGFFGDSRNPKTLCYMLYFPLRLLKVPFLPRRFI
jgi:hypothetical protein